MDEATNRRTVEGAVEVILFRAAQRQEPLPTFSKPDSWPEQGIELGYDDATLNLRPIGDDTVAVLVSSARRARLREDEVSDYTSSEEVADRVEAIWRAGRSA